MAKAKVQPQPQVKIVSQPPKLIVKGAVPKMVNPPAPPVKKK